MSVPTAPPITPHQRASGLMPMNGPGTTKGPGTTMDPGTTIIDGLTFPSAIAFDHEGIAYVAETGLRPNGPARAGRVWRVDAVGNRSLLGTDFAPPITGLVFHDGALWVSQGGPPGRISRLDLDGTVEHVLTDLPGGDHSTSEVAFGPDGKMYWAQGALTNTGVVGLDTLDNGWVHSNPAVLDVPGYDVVLKDVRARTADPFAEEPNASIETGPFSSFGETVQADTHLLGARLFGWPLATAAVHRANPDGSGVELVCWGVRNAFGLRFLPDGRLLALDQGAADRGSRPVGHVPDHLWEIRPGAWYGWPDYFGGRPVTDPRFAPTNGETASFLLANHHELPPPERPLLAFPGSVAATAFDVDPTSDGRIIAASLVPVVTGAQRPPGSAIALIRTNDWARQIFRTETVANPMDLRFHPFDGSLWIVDFGDPGVDGGRRRGRVLRIGGFPGR